MFGAIGYTESTWSCTMDAALPSDQPNPGKDMQMRLRARIHSNPEDVRLILQPIKLINNNPAAPSCNANSWIEERVHMELIEARGQAIHIDSGVSELAFPSNNPDSPIGRAAIDKTRHRRLQVATVGLREDAAPFMSSQHHKCWVHGASV